MTSSPRTATTSPDDGVEWEELSFSVNGSKWGADRPPFPLLQPEKVLSLPLQLRFDEGYRYRLDGTERVGEIRLLRRAVRAGGEPRSRCTAELCGSSAGRSRACGVQAVQSGLSAPVVSNEEIQTYLPVAVVGNRPVFLFTGLTGRQIMLIAGRNILVEKNVAFERFPRQRSRTSKKRARTHGEAIASCIARPTTVCATT